MYLLFFRYKLCSCGRDRRRILGPRHGRLGMLREWTDESARAGHVRVAKGLPIFEQGGPPHPAYLIEQGCVSLSTTDEDGRRVVVTFLFAGDTLCAGVHDTWASAVAVTDCLMSRVPIVQAP